ncbi:MAG: cytochrome c biogenesis protein CcsA [Candidatus Krumholzibacteriota bacterium]|nr:cytochrome c biogenesis protein CcsA [Candidatus Krumholzibacteriota bacterium]
MRRRGCGAARRRGTPAARQRAAVPSALAALLLALALASPVVATADAGSSPSPDSAAAGPAQGDALALTPPARAALRPLLVQDYQGRMKPLDTLSRELAIKVTRSERFGGRDPLDLVLGWALDPGAWWDRPVIAVRSAELKARLGLDPDATHVSAARLVDEDGGYRLRAAVDEALRTPNRDLRRAQRMLLSFNERAQLFLMTTRQATLRLYPLPGDPRRAWLGIEELAARLGPEDRAPFLAANAMLLDALAAGDEAAIIAAADAHQALQHEHGAAVIPSPAALGAELLLNRTAPFRRVIWPYLVAGILLLGVYLAALAGRRESGYTLRHPLYLAGVLLLALAFLAELGGFVLRWLAAGRAPLSNGYETLVWISLIVALTGLLFERRERTGLVAALGALLTAGVLGVSLLAFFDPAIGPLVPVLDSPWLIIHVTVVTASYGFLGLSALLAAVVLLLHLGKGPDRAPLRAAIGRLHGVHQRVLLAGLALLSVGTVLGAVWANESWGRYWGWDAKETWSLVSILVYAAVAHFRFLPGLARPWPTAAGSFAAIAAVIMTYFGVNYFLSGLHSYAGGELASVPNWVGLAALGMAALLLVSWEFESRRSWEPDADPHARDEGGRA